MHSPRMDHWLRLAVILIACLPSGIAAAADDPAKPPPPLNKLTVSYYDFSSGKKGVDINLRHTFKSSTAWIGGYQEHGSFNHARMGDQYNYHRSWLTSVPS